MYNTTTIIHKMLEPIYDTEWYSKLEHIFEDDHFEKIIKVLIKRRSKIIKITPPFKHILRPFYLTPYKDIKAAIIGYLPYNELYQADGLPLSCERCNYRYNNLSTKRVADAMYKNLKKKSNFNYTHWAPQGVFMYNMVLTTEVNNRTSVHSQVWNNFSNEVLKVINNHENDLVILLLGAAIDIKDEFDSRHKILTSRYPINWIFNKINSLDAINYYLKKMGKTEIKWTHEIQNK